MKYAIILAGGIGSRFWPLSKADEPKQFLKLCSDKPMIEETIQRISGLINKKNIYIATNKAHSQKVRDCIRRTGIPLENIFFEPKGKNTLAPIGVLSNIIHQKDPEALIAVLPSDHLIRETPIFLKLLVKAMIAARNGNIITFGIKPDKPETGYGYIKIRPKTKDQRPKTYRVERFIEKPPLEKAQKFLRDGKYYWNSGIFIFSAVVMLNEIKKFQPDTYKIITKNKQELARLWNRLPSISVDYAIMEKTARLALLPADYGWSDLGSWEALEKVMKKDKNNNILRGKCVSLDAKDNIIWSDNRLVAVLGINDVIIVNSKDAVLVCAKKSAQDVKKIVQMLK